MLKLFIYINIYNIKKHLYGIIDFSELCFCLNLPLCLAFLQCCVKSANCSPANLAINTTSTVFKVILYITYNRLSCILIFYKYALLWKECLVYVYRCFYEEYFNYWFNLIWFDLWSKSVFVWFFHVVDNLKFQRMKIYENSA